MSNRRIAQVTQLTSKTTAVTANRYEGIITTVALSDAADTGFNFVVNNEKVQNVTNILLTVEYAGSTGTPIARVVSYAKGSFTVRVINAGTAVLNAVAKIHFKVTHN
jgi:hypothetical protein